MVLAAFTRFLYTNLSTKLRILDAGGNQFAGDIPAGIPKYFNLIQLGLDRNCLAGSIPFSIGKLQNLQQLVFNRNKLSSSIPESIGNLTLLFSIEFGREQLDRKHSRKPGEPHKPADS